MFRKTISLLAASLVQVDVHVQDDVDDQQGVRILAFRDRNYLDLNPIRAGLADTPEHSDFTSIQERIRAWQSESMPEPFAAQSDVPMRQNATTAAFPT